MVCCYLLFYLLYINIEIGKHMSNVRQASDHQHEKIAVYLTVPGDVVDDVFFVLSHELSHEMPWMRFGTESSQCQFLRVFLPTFKALVSKMKL